MNTLIAIAFLLVVIIFLYLQLKSDNPSIPGTCAYPRNKDQQLTFLKYSNEFGDVFRVRFLWWEAVTLFNPADIGQVFGRQYREFKNRAQIGFRVNQLLIQEGIFLDRDEAWTMKRRLLQPLFSWNQVYKIAPVFIEKTNLLLDKWAQLSKDDSIGIMAEMSKITSEVISKTAFGYDLGRIEKGDSSMSDAISIIFTQNTLLNLIPFWYLVPTPLNRKLRVALQALKSTVLNIIEERRTKGLPPHLKEPDLLQTIIDAKDPQTGKQLSDKQIFGEVMTFLLAGHETTATACSWLFYILTQHPDVEKKLIDEIDAQFKGEEVTAENVQKCEYLSMVLEETLRLYPVASLISREAAEDVKLGGYDVKKGTRVLVSIWALHHNPRYWPDPFEFKPERFSPENREKIIPSSYIPFGLGPHVCIGKRMALLEAKIIVAKILQRYQLRLLPDQVVEENVIFLTRPKRDIRMRVHKRTELVQSD